MYGDHARESFGIEEAMVNGWPFEVQTFPVVKVSLVEQTIEKSTNAVSSDFDSQFERRNETFRF